MLERLDCEAAEAAERQIDQFIEKRAKDREEANQEEELWRASERRVREKRREENRELWIAFHGRQHRAFLDLAAHHADKRSRLLLEGGYDPDQGSGEEVG